MGFGPGMFIAAPILQQGDTDQNQELSSGEFRALSQRWFKTWDTNQAGHLDLEKIRSGLNASLMTPPGQGPEGFGPPPAGFGGGRGGGPPGMNLRGREGGRNGLSAMMGVDFPTVRADLEFGGRAYPAVSVRFKGNGTFMQSRGSRKRSMKIDLNDYAAGRKLQGVTKLNLHNGVTDPSWMNEVLSHRLFRDAGVPAPRTAYAEVYLTIRGEQEEAYLGLYSLVENVDNNFALDRFGTKKGAIFKPVTRQPFEDMGDDWAAYQQTYDPKTPLSPEETLRVIEFCKLVSHATDAEFDRQLPAFVDLDEFARFMAVTVWLSTLDSILGVGQNYLVYLRPDTRQFQFVPWDLDHSFGQFTLTGSQEQRENLSIVKPWDGEVRFLERVFRHAGFKALYLGYLREFSGSIFNPQRLQAQVDEVAAAIRPSVQHESEEKLARFDKVTRGESVGPEGFGGFGGRGFGPPGGFGPQPKPIKPFVVVRAQSVMDQLEGRREGVIAGRGGFGGGPGFGPGGPGGLGERGAGAGVPPGFGPGMFLGSALKDATDTDKDDRVTPAELEATFQSWFKAWDTDQSASLNEAELRGGLDKELSPFRGAPPGGFGFPFGGGGPGRGQPPGPGFGVPPGQQPPRDSSAEPEGPGGE